MENNSDLYYLLEESLLQNLINYYTYDKTEFIQKGLEAFINLKGNEKLISFYQTIEKLYKDNNRQKVPIILYGSMVLYYQKKFGESLSDDALALFCHCFYMCDSNVLEKLEDNINSTSKDILEGICQKTDDIYERIDYFTICQNINSEYHDKFRHNVIDNMDKKIYEDLYKKYCSAEAINQILKKEKVNI